MSIQHLFRTQKVEMSDSSDLHEIVTPKGERIAAASSEAALHDLEVALNLALTDAVEGNSDITVEIE